MYKAVKYNLFRIYLLLSRAILFSLFIFTSLLNAQQRELKKDSLKLNDTISGIVEYEYDISKGEDYYDGKFSFQSVTKSQMKNFDYETISYAGEFSSNQKSGVWSYSNKKMKEVDQKFVSGFKVGNLATGTENNVTGQFQEGKAVGNWQALKQDFVKSEVKDTLFQIESTFKDNKLVGSLKSNSETIKVQGYFNADGYFHGQWEIEHTDKDKPILEIRIYKAGVLESHEFKIEDNTFEISYPGIEMSYPDEDEDWEDYTLQEGYFNILNLVDLEVKQSISASVMAYIDAYQEKSNEFIKNSILAFSFSSGLDIWNTIKGTKPLGLGKFKVKKFEFTINEKDKIEKIAEDFNKIQTILEEFSENPKVEIGKPVYEKFNETELIFEVYENEMSQLDRMVEVITSDAFEYVKRDEIYNKIRPKFKFPVEITYEFQSELITKTHDFPESPEQQKFDLDKAHSLIENILEDVETLNQEVQEIFRSMEKEKSLSKDEEKLVEKKDKIENLFKTESEKESYNEYHARYSDLVLNLTEETFNTYGTLNFEEKKNRIKSLLNCYDNLIDFYDFLENIKLKNKRLDDAYTRTTFNPYMMVDMSERIKENIYKAFDKTLKPYLFDKLSNEFSCENVALAMKDINKVYQKMLDLSKKDTKVEEKKLKRQEDPRAILSVLELELKY